MDRVSAVKKINGLLELDRKAIGVKLVTELQYRSFEAKGLVKPMRYCVAVKCAMAGQSVKIDRKTSGCPGGSRALGLIEPPEPFFSGVHGCGMGLYKSEQVASAVARSVPMISPDTYGIIVKPLELFETDPDVVLIAAESRTIMRVLQGYTFTYGLPTGMHMSGNQAVCVECTATPMKTGSVNVSMMCSGTRHSADWKDTESMIGIPFAGFYGTVEGIEGTVNAVEPDDRKRSIETALRGAKLLDIEVEYGKTYYARKK
ncbi:MAG: DUF169 domain-containing protein [Deltaproteobacteria bacterium]|nr:DUF169 domain-containing protein [Deltaproteobacteria bacterium]